MTVPDKIWVVTGPRRNSTTGWWWSFDPEGDAVEYTRSDIQKTTIIAQVAEIARLLKALADIIPTNRLHGVTPDSAGKQVWFDGPSALIARAALEGTPK